MTNPYYNHTSGQPVSLSRGASSTMRAEYDLIAAGFTSASADIAARGLVAGQTWTGVHDYTGGTLRVTTQLVTDNSTLVASTGFVQQLAAYYAAQGAAGQLPSQAGKTDYFLTTDSSVSSWGNTLKTSVIRFKDGADATKLLAFDISAFTTGTTRTVAWPDKSGTAALTNDVGLTTPLAIITPTAVASVSAPTIFNSTYDSYLITGEGLCPASDAILAIRFAVGGSVVSTASYAVNNVISGGSAAFNSTEYGTHFSSSVASSGSGLNFECIVHNANSSTGLKSASFKGAFDAGGSLVSISNDMGFKAGVVTGIEFHWGGGVNFKAQGTIRIYGIRKA